MKTLLILSLVASFLLTGCGSGENTIIGTADVACKDAGGVIIVCK
jgi:predicted small secreted protein